MLCHLCRRLVQVAAVFVVHDVGVQQFVMLPSSSDHQPPQKKRTGSILREPVPATGSGSASSFGTHLSGAQDLHMALFTSYLHVQARRRNRRSEQHGKGNHKNGNWCKASYVARRDALHGSAVRYQKPNNHPHLQKQPNRVRNLFEVRVPFWLLTVINCAATMRGDYAGGST